MARSYEGFSPFSLLPDELVLKILEMSVATGDKSKPYDEVELIHNIGKVSKRFQRIVSTKSFWKGDVSIWLTLDDQKAQQLKQLEVLHNDIENLLLETDFVPEEPILHDMRIIRNTLSEDHFQVVAQRCPNLKRFELNLEIIRRLPTLKSPWCGLGELILFGIQVKEDDAFALDFHVQFPNLCRIEMMCCGYYYNGDKEPLKMPNLIRCQKLQTIKFSKCMLKFPENIDCPFPSELRMFTTIGTSFVNLDFDTVKINTPHCVHDHTTMVDVNNLFDDDADDTDEDEDEDSDD